VKTNRNYKDSVFSLLFSDPEVLRELYCALDGVSLPPGVPVSINTLEDVIFMDKINDISFEIDGKLVVLIEHQSTINPNIALRLLMYIGRVYEKIFKDKNIYKGKLFKVPRPEFFVLYNGAAPCQDEQIFRLSDTFEELKKLGLVEKGPPALELIVRVININEGRNAAIAERCRILAEYSALVAKVREFEKELGNKEEAMKEAVKYCQNHDILKEFLEKHASEVLNMLMTEWCWDDALEVRYEEGVEDGLERTARNLLAKSMPIEDIALVTELPIEKIRSLSCSADLSAD